MFISRARRSGPDRFLGTKLALFFLAAGIWVAGAWTGRGWLTWIAIPVLVCGFVLGRFRQNRESSEVDEAN